MSILDILSIVFAFSLLVLIHELGHYLAARWMGVRVERFSIGFPPVLFSKKIGETEFAISAIPLGGYVKMAGFIDESMDTKIEGKDYEYSSKPVWKRMVIITAGVIMNLILAVVLYTMISYSQGEIINPATTVKISHESGIAEKIGFRDGDKIVRINDKEITNWNQVLENFIQNVDKGLIFSVMRSGEELNLEYKSEWLKEDKGEFLDLLPIASSQVGEVSKGMPADETGLVMGDIITELNGIQVSTWDEMTEIIRANPEHELSIKWRRGEKEYSGSITPIMKYEKNESGEEISYGLIGIRNYYIHKPITLDRAFIIGIQQPVMIIYLNIKGLWWWISGIKSADQTLGGPVTIAKLAGEAAERGWISYLSLIAALSSVLAFFNILPIPALDGGHMAFLVAEGIMRKPLSIKTRLVIQQIGIALLLSFIIFVLYVDINRIFF